MTDRHPALVTAEELLMGRLPAPKFVDGSWHLDKARNAGAEFEAGHLPGAVRFDLDRVAETETDLPHMLPRPNVFAEAVGEMGIAHTDAIVIYDTGPLFAAPRVWWTFRTMGAERVFILDGGLPAWKDAGGEIGTGSPFPEPARFLAQFDDGAVIDADGVRQAIETGAAQVVDARPAARFRGEAPEPRAGLRSGSMPGSVNVPSSELVDPDGRLKDGETLAEIFAAAGVATDRPLITSCGSGVTAALLLLALEAAGYPTPRLYDGSWAEWGREGSTTSVV